MLKKFSRTIATVIGYGSLLSAKTLAACDLSSGGVFGGINCAQQPGQGNNLLNKISTVTTTLLLVVGIAAVIMIIIGAIRYVLSGGDPAGVKGAKDTIIYSAVGLVVAILAYAIVKFVISQFK